MSRNMYKKIIMEGQQEVYFSSDFHGYHKNICRGTSEWDDASKTRDFDTVDKMNETILKGINSTVGHDDWLVFLGDFTFDGEDKIEKFRHRIVCHNIIFVKGNHDQHCHKHKELFESFHDYLELTVSSSKHGKNTYNLMHFPIAVWNKAHKERMHLHGHTHGTFTGQGKCMDVGIDNAFKLLGEYRPFSQKEIHKHLDKKVWTPKSHHDKNTN